MNSVKNPRIYFSVFLGVAVVLVSYYFSQALFSHLGVSKSPASVEITSSGDAPKFSESGPLSDSSQTVNLTQQAIADIGTDFYTKTQNMSDAEKNDLYAQIKAGNIEGVTDPQKLAEGLGPEAIGIRTEIADSDIVPDRTNDLAAYRRRYLLAVTDVDIFLSTDSPIDAIRALIEKDDGSKLNVLVNSFQSTYTSLKDMQVPDAAREFHKKNLLYFSNSVTVYSAIRQHQTDPLRAYLAAQYIETLAQEWKEIYSIKLL